MCFKLLGINSDKLCCSEFDKYQVVINVRRQGSAAPITRNRDEPTEWEFKESLEPGRTYHVLVKTVSGKVTSWPAAVNVTVSEYNQPHINLIIQLTF